MRFVRRGLLILVVVLAVCVGTVVVYAHSSAARRHVRAVILRELNETYGIPTELDEVTLHFWPPTVVVRGLRVSHPTEGPFLEARAVMMTLDPWSLVRGRYRIEEITVVEPTVRLRIRDGRLVNLPEPRTASEGGESPVVEAFAVLGGTVVAEIDAGDGVARRIRLEDVNLDVTGTRNELFEVRARVSGGEVTWGEVARSVARFETRLGVTPSEVRVRRLRAELGDDVRLDVANARFALGEEPAGEAEVTAAMPLDLLARLPEWGDRPALAGAARAAGRVAYGRSVPGPSRRPGVPAVEASFDLAIDGAVLDGMILGNLAGAVAYDDDGLHVSALDADLDVLDPALPFRGGLRMAGLQFAPLLERFGVPRSKVTQTFDGTIAFDGTAVPFRIGALLDTEVTEFALYGGPFRSDDHLVVLDLDRAHVVGGVEVDRDQLFIVPTVVTHGASRHTVNGRYGFHDDRFTLDIVSEPLAAADVGELLEIPISGTGPAHTLLDGPIDDLTITAEMALRDFRYLGMAFGDIRANLHFADLVLSFPEIRASRGESVYDVSRLAFDLGMAEPGRWGATADITARPVRIADVPAVLQGQVEAFAGWDGWVDGRARLTYRSWLERFDVEFDGRGRRMLLAGRPVDAAVVRGSYAEGKFRVPYLRLERLGGWVEGEAQFDTRGRFTATLTGGNLALHKVFPAETADVDLEGTAAFRAEIEGTGGTVTGRARVHLAGVSVAGRALGDAALSVLLEPNDRVRAWGAFDRPAVRFDALAQLGPHPRIGLVADFDALEPLAFLDDPDLEPYRLVIDGRTEMVLEPGRTLRVRGRADLDTMLLSAPQGEVRALEPVRLGFTERGISVRQGRFLLPGPAEATVLGYAGTDGLDFEIRGGADLAALAALVDGAPPIAGRLDAAVRIEGTFDHPVATGSARVSGGRVELPEPLGPLEALEAELTLTPSRIAIDRAAGEILGGRVRIEGAVAFERFTPVAYDLDLDFGGLAYRITPTLPVSFDGTLQVSGDRAGGFRPNVGGDVYITRLAYTEPIRLGVSLADISRPDIEAIPTFRPEDDNVRFDVRLHGENLVLRNNLIDAVFRLDDAQQPFRAVGTNQVFGLVGAVVIDHGVMEWRRGRFQVTRGTIAFDSPYRIDPRFDVVAETEVRDWRITLTATGRRNDLEILTTASPDLGQDDIVLLLTVGMTREEAELLGASGAVGGALAEVFDEALGVSERFGRYVPILDQMRITTEYSPRTGRSEPRIAIGKRITDDARIEASSSLTDARDFRAVFRYQVTDDLSLEGVYDNNNDAQFGNLGADVRWRIEF
jgi:translocation and assembly module TamB